jgi:1,4-dihydroxy-2-naphthoate octaprenyltransferase
MSQKSIICQLLLFCSLCVALICYMLWQETDTVEDSKFWALCVMSSIFYTGALIVFSRIKQKDTSAKK